MEKTAIQIIKKFQKAGYETYFAGGSVRDLLMEQEPFDYDIATSAEPDEIEKLMPKTISIGKQFGVILTVVNGHHFEIATFRSDSSYSDGRRPNAILFTSAKEDALRRDFTINGLFYDPIKKQVLDFVKGQKDIQNKILRFIGAPHERIKEDHLRILRAVRFKNQFGFKYNPTTKRAIADLAHLINDISKERIAEEITKMLLHSRRSHSMKELEKFGILQKILPEITNTRGVKQPPEYHKEGDVFNHILKALHDMPEKFISKELVWAVLLHDIGKPATYEERPDRVHFDGHAKLSAQMAKKICRRLKFSKVEIGKIEWLIANHMQVGYIPQMRRAHQMTLFWNPWFEDLMKLHYCDEKGSVPCDFGLYHQVMKLYREFKEMKLLEDHFKPFLAGDEIIKECKITPGPIIKKILTALREAQMEGMVKNKKEAKEFVKQFLFE